MVAGCIMQLDCNMNINKICKQEAQASCFVGRQVVARHGLFRIYGEQVNPDCATKRDEVFDIKALFCFLQP
jgi:hypothetical protein